MSPLLLRLLEFAARKHRDQRRKGEEASPYIQVFEEGRRKLLSL
jgi:hypothetical protein